MKKYIIEFIGTFFLVFVITLVINDPQVWAKGGTPFAPIAIGTILMVMVYMGGHISGAHYNPAVTLAVLINKKISSKDAGMYMVFQFAAGLVAAWLYYFIFGFGREASVPTPLPGYAYNLKPLLVEAIFTFALAMVVLNTAYAKANSGNSFYGLAIGSTIMAAAFAGGPISGGAFNPSVGFGPLVVSSALGLGKIDNLWIYIVGPFLGAAIAALVYRWTNKEG